MVGMATTSNTSLSDYRSRYVVIDVAGMANQAISRVSNYQVKVPFNRMSAAIRSISCQGGKVIKVTVQEPSSLAAVTPAPAAKPAVKPAGTNKENKAVASKKTSARKKTTPSRSPSRKSSRSRKK